MCTWTKIPNVDKSCHFKRWGLKTFSIPGCVVLIDDVWKLFQFQLILMTTSMKTFWTFWTLLVLVGIDFCCDHTCKCKCCNLALDSKGTCWCLLALWSIIWYYNWPRYYTPLNFDRCRNHMYNWNFACAPILMDFAL